MFSSSILQNPPFFQTNILIIHGKAEDYSDVISEPLDKNWKMVASFLSPEAVGDKSLNTAIESR